MKPKDLPFYDFELQSTSSNKEILQGDDVVLRRGSTIENGVKRVRILAQENTKPLQEVLLKGHAYVTSVRSKAKDSYSRIYHPNMWFNISIISGSIVSGWILNSLLYKKHARVRRFLTPVLLGTATATYFYPGPAKRFASFVYQSGHDKYNEIKARTNGTGNS